MDLRVNGVQTGAIGDGAVRGIVYALEGSLSEVDTKRRLGGGSEGHFRTPR
jgi:hypothetical protein